MVQKYFPEIAVVELTGRCNLNCIVCGSDSKNIINPAELSITEWCKAVDDLAAIGLKRFVLSGGEPTLKPGIGRLIEHIVSRKIEWAMVSNGFSLSAALLATFQQYKPYAVGISVDGTLATHNQLRGNPRSFQRLQQNIRKLQAAEIPLTIITTLHKANWQELPKIAGFVAENEIYGWQIQLAMPFGRMKKNQELLLSQKEFLCVCLLVEKIKKSLPMVNVAAADCFAWAPRGRIREGKWLGCQAGLRVVGIDALGNVRGCLAMTECQPDGNIKKRKISEIWHDPETFLYNRQFKTTDALESCQKCQKLLDCKGGCNAQSFSMTGKFHQGAYCWYRINKEKRR